MAKSGVAYGILKEEGVDTTGMTPKEAWEKVNELRGKSGSQKLKEEEIKNNTPKYNKGVTKFYNPQEQINAVKKYANNINDERAKQQIDEYIKDIEDEPKITEDMIQVADKVGSKLLGFDFRTKSANSFLRKISGEDGKIKDNVRYTFEIGDDIYETYSKVVENLKNMGYKEIIVKNYWNNDKKAYNGINTNFISPTGRILEVQYHSEEGLKVKERMHKLYEEQRLLSETDPKFQEYERQMFEMSNNLHRPSTVDKIVNKDMEV